MRRGKAIAKSLVIQRIPVIPRYSLRVSLYGIFAQLVDTVSCPQLGNRPELDFSFYILLFTPSGQSYGALKLYVFSKCALCI